MKLPLEVTYRDVAKTDYIDDLIREKAAKIDRMCDRLISCRVAVEKRNTHQKTGRPFRVRIDLKIPPDHELVVCKESTKGDLHQELPLIVREAFESARRQLKKLMEVQDGKTKRHPEQEINAVIFKVFQNYGFLRNLEDGREIYFHKNSLINHDFEHVNTGLGVRYVERPGEQGPQASSVQVVDRRPGG